MLKHGFVALFFGATLLAAYGCGGFTTQEAVDQCHAEQMSRADCFDDKSYASCLACFEDCGSDCVPSNDCPERYVCPNDQNPTGQQPE